MAKIELHTEVEEIIPAEDVPGFVIKRVDLGGISLQTPIRTLYSGTDIPARARRIILDLKERRETLLEVNRTIYMDKSYESILRAVRESDDDSIRDVFKLSERLSDYNVALPFSFSQFPRKVFDKNFERFLDYLHEYSTILFVPHVRFNRQGGATSVKYEANTFTRYVDYAVGVLNEWNTKPIFVPFDIDYDAETMDRVLAHYAEKGYTNIWVDFKGHTFTKNRAGRMRSLRRKINEFFGQESKNVVIYLANIKKIQREHPKEVKLRPSDVLGAFVYGDIVGVPWKGIVWPSQGSDDYWIKKGFSSKEEYEEAMFKRDSSIFDNGSYYYWHPDKISLPDLTLNKLRKEILSLKPGQKSVAEKISYSVSNAVALHELEGLKRKVMVDGVILDHLESKEFFTTSGRGILANIRAKSKKNLLDKKDTMEKPSTDLFDFM